MIRYPRLRFLPHEGVPAGQWGRPLSMLCGVEPIGGVLVVGERVRSEDERRGLPTAALRSKREQVVARAALHLDAFLAGERGREAVAEAYRELVEALSDSR